MAKKLLFMEDLIHLFEQKKLTHFSSAEHGYSLSVQVPATFEVDDNVDDDHRGMLKLKIKAYHIGKNRNGSFVSEESARAAMNTLKNRPVLAYIHQLDSGEWDFETHNMEIVENEDGEEEINYLEKQVGSFSEEDAFIEHDDENDTDFVCAYAYVAEEYTKAASIIQRKQGTKTSCELEVEELSYNSKEKYLELKKFFVGAVTLLGSRADGTEIGEGMKGSRADIVEFSYKNNSVLSPDEKLFEILDKLNTTLSNFNINTNGKEDARSMHNENIPDGVAADEVVDVVQDVVDEFAEKPVDDDVQAASDVEEVVEDDVQEENEAVDEVEAVSEEAADEEASEDVSDDADVDAADDADSDDASDTFSANYSIGGMNFSVSLDQIIYALDVLVNETYAEADGTYYGVHVYAEDKNVVMVSWNGQAYRQAYKERKGVYSLVGDRVPVHACWLTDDEEAKLDNMKANYADLSAKVEKFESEPQKKEIFASDDYANIRTVAEFVELSKEDNHFDLSVEEVKEKCDAILLSYAKGNKIEFANSDNKSSAKRFAKGTKKSKGRYGNLFSNKNN